MSTKDFFECSRQQRHLGETEQAWTRAKMDTFDENARKRHLKGHYKFCRELFEIHILELIKHHIETQY